MAWLRLSLYAYAVVVFVNPTKVDVEMIMHIMHHFSGEHGGGTTEFL
jgi:hypothetical protein